MTMTVTVMNLKGGSAKTTTAAHLAHAYAARGKNVLVVDADPQGSILEWSQDAGWDIPVMGMAVPRLHMLLPGIIGEKVDVVVIDTPPYVKPDQDEKRKPGASKVKALGIIGGALRAADYILVPMGPTTIEMKRRRDVWDAIEDVNLSLDKEIPTAVLLNRAVNRAASTEIAREVLVEEGWNVLTTTIPRLEAIAQSDGAPITNLFGHDQVIIELERVAK